MYLLDTCALSELVARHPNPHAVDGIMALPQNEWFISAVTVGEIKRGIESMESGKRRNFLETWFTEHVVGIYLHKVIVFDVEEATAWGALVAMLKRKSLPMSVIDSQIAATAIAHDLVVVTGNDSDFAHDGVKIYNPWKK